MKYRERQSMILIHIMTFCVYMQEKYNAVCPFFFMEIPCKIQLTDYKLKWQCYMLDCNMT